MSLLNNQALYTIVLLGCFLLIQCRHTVEPWDNGVVRYYIDHDFNSEEVKSILTSTRYFSDNTNLKFVRVYKKGDFICNIEKVGGSMNSATIGKSRNCWIKLDTSEFCILIHELAHTAGLWHEHQRPDRDKWVKVFSSDIEEHLKDSYEIKHDHLYDIDSYPYEYKSLMHYSESEATEGHLLRMRFLHRFKPRIRDTSNCLSDLDIQKINNIYPTNNTQWVSTKDMEK